jgi:hypothetical protein
VDQHQVGAGQDRHAEGHGRIEPADAGDAPQPRCRLEDKGHGRRRREGVQRVEPEGLLQQAPAIGGVEQRGASQASRPARLKMAASSFDTIGSPEGFPGEGGADRVPV